MNTYTTQPPHEYRAIGDEVYRWIGNFPDPRDQEQFWRRMDRPEFIGTKRGDWVGFIKDSKIDDPLPHNGHSTAELKAAGMVSLWKAVEPGGQRG